MKRTWRFRIPALLLAALMAFPAAAAACVHYGVDVMDEDLIWRNRRQPTETEPGYTGDAYCPIEGCGALCIQGTEIPPLGGGTGGDTPAGGAETPTGGETGGETPTGEEPGNPEPADPPAENPAPEAPSVPASEPDPAPVPQPEAPVLPPSDPAPMPASKPEEPVVPPAPVSPAENPQDPPAEPDPAAVTDVQPVQPVPPAEDTTANRAPEAEDSGSVPRGGGILRTIRKRDEKRFPIFSSRFPYRRLKMNVSPEIRAGFRAKAAGILRWPLPESNGAASPLHSLLGP